MLEAWVTLTPLQRAIMTVIRTDKNPRKIRAAMRVARASTKQERDQACSVLVALGLIEDRGETWL